MKQKPPGVPMMFVGLMGVVAVFVLLVFFPNKIKLNDPQQSAAVYFVSSLSTADLKEQFHQQEDGIPIKPVRILVVPGHEPDYGGTEYKNLKERDLNVLLGQQIFTLLQADDRFEVTLARDNNDWDPDLKIFLDKESEDTEEFVLEQKEITQNLLEEGKLNFENKVSHGDAPKKTALLLYGVNRWASESGFDIILNLHFNDSASRKISKNWPSGFAIYVPDPQFSNAEPSYDIAKSIFERLVPFYAVSNLEQEEDGVIFDEKLIALGANNTLDPASILIEYGYIYEPRFKHKTVREALINDFAYKTYLGLRDFFEADIDLRSTQGVQNETTLIHPLVRPVLPIAQSPKSDPDVLILQAMLLKAGVFPANGKTLTDCVLDGIFGGCTRDAVEEFQIQRGISNDGVVGNKTYQLLEEKLFKEKI